MSHSHEPTREVRRRRRRPQTLVRVLVEHGPLWVLAGGMLVLAALRALQGS